MTRRLALIAAIASGWVALAVYWLSDPWWRGNLAGVDKGIRIGNGQRLDRRNVE